MSYYFPSKWAIPVGKLQPLSEPRSNLYWQFVKHPIKHQHAITLIRDQMQCASEPYKTNKQTNINKTKNNKEGTGLLLSDILDLFLCLLAVMRLLIVSPCSARCTRLHLFRSAWKTGGDKVIIWHCISAHVLMLGKLASCTFTYIQSVTVTTEQPFKITM